VNRCVGVVAVLIVVDIARSFIAARLALRVAIPVVVGVW
jgi:hypothetical protein